MEGSSKQFVDGLSNRANFRKDFCKKTRNINSELKYFSPQSIKLLF